MQTTYFITGLYHWVLLHARANWPDLLPQPLVNWGDLGSLLHPANLSIPKIKIPESKEISLAPPRLQYVIRRGWVNPDWI